MDVVWVWGWKFFWGQNLAQKLSRKKYVCNISHTLLSAEFKSGDCSKPCIKFDQNRPSFVGDTTKKHLVSFFPDTVYMLWLYLTYSLDADGRRRLTVQLAVGDAEQSELIGGSSRRRRPVVRGRIGRDAHQRHPLTDCAILDVVTADRSRRLGGRVMPQNVDGGSFPRRRDVDRRQRPHAVYDADNQSTQLSSCK